MSQKSNTRKRSAHRAQHATPAGVYSDLTELVRSAPLPSSLMIRDSTRSSQREALVPAIAWGWLLRTLRTGQAAINLESAGYGAEASPLVRASLEHAIRLQWAAEYGSEFVEVALIAQKNGYAKLQGAQTDNWKFSTELANALEDHAAEASDEYKSVGTLTTLRSIVNEYPDKLGSLYVAWLFDTQESHPSILTARHYFESDDLRGAYRLLEQSRFQSSVGLKSCYALVGAVDGYAKLVGLSAHVEGPLETIGHRLVALGASSS